MAVVIQSVLQNFFITDIINKNNTRKKVEMPTHKVCNECKINKSIDHYWNKKSSGDGKDNKCTQCHNAKRKS